MKQSLLNRFLWPALATIALFGVFWWHLHRIEKGDVVVSDIPSPLIGKPAPSMDLPALTGPAERVRSADFAGKPWMLNVWGTWCAACRDEHPTLVSMAQRLGVPIVGLNWKDDSAAARRWLESLGDPYVAVGIDASGRAAIDWGVYGAPETFLIGADGTVLAKHIGPMTDEVWTKRFLPKLAPRTSP